MHPASRKRTRRTALGGVGLAGTALSCLLASSIAFAQTQNTTPSKPIDTPISGPEFEAPLQRLTDNENGEAEQGPPDPAADTAYGAFQRGYFLTALALALPRAESGDPAAQTLIAEIYWNGHGVARDRKKAVDWYRFAAEGGNREAQFAYGNILLQGQEAPLDKAQGEIYLRKAAEAGHTRAAFNLAQLITSARPTWAGFKRALPFYVQAAEAGVPDAQYALANMHAEAMGVPYNDEAKAIAWMRRAAEGGFAPAQLELGVWLVNGRGVPKAPKQAYEWVRRAAAQRNTVAQNRLARMYAFGIGTQKDPIKAGAWHILSRRAGFSDSELDRVFQAYSEIDQKRAIEAANQLRRRLSS